PCHNRRPARCGPAAEEEVALLLRFELPHKNLRASDVGFHVGLELAPERIVVDELAERRRRDSARSEIVECALPRWQVARGYGSEERGAHRDDLPHGPDRS